MDHKKILHKAKRTACFVAAVIFLVEAWLWDHLYPIVAKLVSWFPWDNAKKLVAAKIEHLPAWACVFVFIIPALAILPIKIIGVYLISTDHVFWGIIVFLLAKMVGLGLAAFLFETCRDRLLSIRWFLWLYNTVLIIRKWAGEQVAPALRQLRRYKKMGMFAVLKKLRRNIIYRTKKL